jgi:hypothetical protein
MIKHFETPVTWEWKESVAVDFESFYDKKTHSIDTLGGWAYNRHPKSFPFLVAISDGERLWVGHPEKFDWTTLKGRTLCAHNAGHDADVVNAGIERGAWPDPQPKEWICTADLSTYLTGHRSLAAAMKALFDVELSKQVRTDANGKTWEDMQREEITLADGTKTTFAQAMIDYAGDDTQCLRIWTEHGHKWPERERRISRLNRERGWYGVRIDVPELRRSVSLARRVVAESEAKLPWVERGLKPGSTNGIHEECRKDKIPAPPVKSGKNGDPEAAEEWLEEYGGKLPWVKALKDLRKGAKILATLEKMESRLRDDETIPFSLLYYGAHTGRFAGSGGINFQNFNKEALFVEHDPENKGIDIRGLLIPRKGKRFAIVDLSQIEPRCLDWLTGNEVLLNLVRNGMALYEAFARTALGWKGGNLKKENKYRYNLAKAQKLALNYKAQWRKFIVMALQPMYGNLDLCADDEKVALELSLDKTIYVDVEDGHELVGGKNVKKWRTERYDAETHGRDDKVLERRFVAVTGPNGTPVREYLYGCNARKVVKEFRDSNPLICGPEGIWAQLDKGLRAAASKKQDFTIELPDGGVMTYRNCRFEKRRKQDKETGEFYTKNEVRFDQGSRSESTYSGKLTENLCQRFGREVFVEGFFRADDAGFTGLFSVHDEGIHEVDDDGTPLFEADEKGEMRRVARASADHVEDGFAPTLWKVINCYAQTPAWAPGLPVAAEGVWADCYLK